MASYFCESMQVQRQLRKLLLFPHCFSAKGLKATVVNQACHATNGGMRTICSFQMQCPSVGEINLILSPPVLNSILPVEIYNLTNYRYGDN